MLVAITTSLMIASPVKADTPLQNFGGLSADHRFYNRLSHCETGQNAKHNQPSYTSAFGVTYWVWRTYSGHTSAVGYDLRYQAKVVDRFMFTGWTDLHGKFQPPLGPWGFGTVKNNCAGLQTFLCQSRKPIVHRWCRK